MINFKNLKISNVGRFVGDHFIDFDSLEELFQIDGKNKNTGGSSGSAKSTICNALDYLLGVNDIPTTVLQSRLTKEPMCVEAEIEKDNEIYHLKRAKTGGLSIKGPSGEVSGSSKVSEEYLSNLIGIPNELLRPVFHKRQKEGGFFIKKTPKEMYEFMSSCLDLKKYTQKQDLAETKFSILKPQIIVLTDKIKNLESSLDTVMQTKNSITAPVSEVEGETIRRLEAVLEQENSKRLEIGKEQRSKLDKVAKPVSLPGLDYPASLSEIDLKISKIRENKSLKINALKKEKTDIQIKLNQAVAEEMAINHKAKDIPRYESELTNLKTQIEKIKSNKCPTCEQDWTGGVSHGNYSDLVDKAKKIFLSKQSAAVAKESLPDLLSVISGLQSELVAQDNKVSQALSSEEEMILLAEKDSIAKEFRLLEMDRNQKNAQEIEKYNLATKEINDTYSKIIGESDQQVGFKRDLLNKSLSLLDSYKKQKESYDSTILKVEEQAVKLNIQIKENRSDLVKIERESKLAETSAALIKSYVNQLFYESLTQIAEKATSNLSQIPNMETACITFEVFKENKNGSIKEEINPVLSMDGEESISIKSLSGGEKTSIDLSIDLAVIDMIEERTGKGINLFILDEPFDGLETVNIERCIEVLKVYGIKKKIGIVAHDPIIKEMVTSRITVERDGQNSRII